MHELGLSLRSKGKDSRSEALILICFYFIFQAQKMLAIGNFEKANFYQRLTRALILISLGFGFLCWIAYGILIYYRFIVATSPDY